MAIAVVECKLICSATVFNNFEVLVFVPDYFHFMVLCASTPLDFGNKRTFFSKLLFYNFICYYFCFKCGKVFIHCGTACST